MYKKHHIIVLSSLISTTALVSPMVLAQQTKRTQQFYNYVTKIENQNQLKSTLESYVPAIFNNPQLKTGSEIKTAVIEELNELSQYESSLDNKTWIFSGYEPTDNTKQTVRAYITTSWDEEPFALDFKVYKSNKQNVISNLNKELQSQTKSEKWDPSWESPTRGKQKSTEIIQKFHLNQNKTLNINGESVTIVPKRFKFDHAAPEVVNKPQNEVKVNFFWDYFRNFQQVNFKQTLTAQKEKEREKDKETDKDKVSEKVAQGIKTGIGVAIGAGVVYLFYKLKGFLTLKNLLAKILNWIKDLFRSVKSSVRQAVNEFKTQKLPKLRESIKKEVTQKITNKIKDTVKKPENRVEVKNRINEQKNAQQEQKRLKDLERIEKKYKDDKFWDRFFKNKERENRPTLRTKNKQTEGPLTGLYALSLDAQNSHYFVKTNRQDYDLNYLTKDSLQNMKKTLQDNLVKDTTQNFDNWYQKNPHIWQQNIKDVVTSQNFINESKTASNNVMQQIIKDSVAALAKNVQSEIDVNQVYDVKNPTDFSKIDDEKEREYYHQMWNLAQTTYAQMLQDYIDNELKTDIEKIMFEEMQSDFHQIQENYTNQTINELQSDIYLKQISPQLWNKFKPQFVAKMVNDIAQTQMPEFINNAIIARLKWAIENHEPSFTFIKKRLTCFAEKVSVSEYYINDLEKFVKIDQLNSLFQPNHIKILEKHIQSVFKNYYLKMNQFKNGNIQQIEQLIHSVLSQNNQLLINNQLQIFDVKKITVVSQTITKQKMSLTLKYHNVNEVINLTINGI